VSRADAGTGRFNAEYPMLITARHLILGGRILDIDLAEPPISLWTNGSVVPGSGPGVVWLTQRVHPFQGDSHSVWVSPVDVESLTVGERVDITDVFSRPIAGVADGLIVVDLEGELAFWSPTDGLVPLDLPGADALYAHQFDADGLSMPYWFVAASGNLVVVAANWHVRVLDIVSGEYVGPPVNLFDLHGSVTSACLSPDGQHVIVVGQDNRAVVGNTTTGEVLALNEMTDIGIISVHQKHGIGWTTDDQLVFIGAVEDVVRDVVFGDERGDAKLNIFGLDISSGESFAIAELHEPENLGWWLTASGTMC
jgi:hypothetical protein